MAILVAGASGQLGRAVVIELLSHVPSSELILVSRTPEKLDFAIAAGATVRFGDYGKPESLPAAFEGASRALLISGMPPGPIVEYHANAFQAAARAGIGHIVYTSFPNPVEANPAPPAAYQRASENALLDTGVAWTILRNALYADLRAQIAQAYIRDARWTTNAGDGKHAFVSRADCASAAAAVLCGPDHEGKIYDITGPELIGFREFTAILEEAAGDAIECVSLDDIAFEEHRARFSARPENASYIELFTGTGTAMRGGHLCQVTDDVLSLTGRRPKTLSMELASERDRKAIL